MRWLPDYDLGIVALGNVTYAGYRKLCGEALALLIEKTVLSPRQPQIAPALAAARDGIIRLMAEWDDDLAADLFADNVLLDSDAEHRQRELAELRAQHGALHADGPFMIENWLRGQWRMAGERGWVDVAITLSPTVPPQVQEWELVSHLNTDAA